MQLSGISIANGRGPQLIELQQVNERAIDLYRDQLPFEELTTINPNRWIKLENGADKLSDARARFDDARSATASAA